MAKIFEVDFTKFDPPSTFTAVDNVGGQNLSTFTSTGITKENPLPGFTNRPGIRFNIGGSSQNYNLTSTSPNASWHGVFDQRSWVLWFYTPGVLTEPRCPIWLECLTDANTVYNGLRTGVGVPQDLILWLDAAGPITFTEVFNNAGWYNVVITMDKRITETRAYINGTFVDVVSSVSPSSPSSGSMIHIFGDNGSTRESNLSYAYMATYDHVLSPSEVEGIYNAFLTDEDPAGPPGKFVGNVFDLTGTPVSGADVFLVYNENPDSLVAQTTTSGDGYYELEIPYFGDFTLVSSKPPTVAGARAVSFTLDGPPGSGTITLHDGMETEL